MDTTHTQKKSPRDDSPALLSVHRATCDRVLLGIINPADGCGAGLSYDTQDFPPLKHEQIHMLKLCLVGYFLPVLFRKESKGATER
ncbi:hypothetical protein LEMLEM_LOCUS7825, partial [Lemmus lemmus]